MSNRLEDPTVLMGVIRALSAELGGVRVLAASAAELMRVDVPGEFEADRQRRLAARGMMVAAARGVSAGAGVLGDPVRLRLLERLGDDDVSQPSGLLEALLVELGEGAQLLPLARPARDQAMG